MNDRCSLQDTARTRYNVSRVNVGESMVINKMRERTTEFDRCCPYVEGQPRQRGNKRVTKRDVSCSY